MAKTRRESVPGSGDKKPRGKRNPKGGGYDELDEILGGHESGMDSGISSARGLSHEEVRTLALSLDLTGANESMSWPPELLEAFLTMVEEIDPTAELPSPNNGNKVIFTNVDGKRGGVSPREALEYLRSLLAITPEDVQGYQEAARIFDEVVINPSVADPDQSAPVIPADPDSLSPDFVTSLDLPSNFPEFPKTHKGPIPSGLEELFDGNVNYVPPVDPTGDGVREIQDAIDRQQGGVVRVEGLDRTDLVDIASVLDSGKASDLERALTADLAFVGSRFRSYPLLKTLHHTLKMEPWEIEYASVLDDGFVFDENSTTFTLKLPLKTGEVGSFTLSVQGLKGLIQLIESQRGGDLLIESGDSSELRKQPDIPPELRRFASEDIGKMVELAEEMEGRGVIVSFDTFAGAFGTTLGEFAAFMRYFKAATLYPRELRNAYGVPTLDAIRDFINSYEQRGEEVPLKQLEELFHMGPGDYTVLIRRLGERGVLERHDSSQTQDTESLPEEKLKDLRDLVVVNFIYEPEISVLRIQQDLTLSHEAATRVLESFIAEGELEPIDGKEGVYAWSENFVRTVLQDETPVLHDAAPVSPLKYFDTRFERGFGITQEELASIPGIEHLSPAQQKLIFENFTQLVTGEVFNDAAQLYHDQKESLRKDSVARYGKIMGSFRASVSEFLTVNKAELEQHKAQRVTSGGFERHQFLLASLVESIQMNGPRVHEENGELMIDFVNISYDREHRQEEIAAVEAVNRAGHALARIPHAWGVDTIGVDDTPKNAIVSFLDRNVFSRKAHAQKDAYTEARARFDIALKGLANTLQASGVQEHEISRILIDVESRVHQQQTIQTDPNALELLSRAENQGALTLAGKQLFQKSGTVGYMALGFASRSALGLAFGFAGAPLAASAVAYLRSRSRTADELRERDRVVRQGLGGPKKEGDLNLVDSSTQVKKIEYLLNRIDLAPQGERSKLLASLKTRIDFVRETQDSGRMRYGDRPDAVKNQTDLAIRLGIAGTYWAEGMQTAGAGATAAEVKKSGRLQSQLTHSKSKIKSVRKEFRDGDAKRSVLWAAGFSAAGALIADLVRGDGIMSRIRGTNSGLEEALSEGVRPPVGQGGATPGQPGTAASAAESGPVARSAAMPASAPASAPSPAASAPGDIVAQAEGGRAAPAEAVVSRPSALGEHTVSKGDTLTKIVNEQIPEYKDVSRAEIFKRLALLTPEELKGVGISSENINEIGVGDRVKLEQLHELLKGKDLSQGVLEQGVLLDPELPDSDYRGPAGEKSEYDFERERQITSGATTSVLKGTDGKVPTRSLDLSPLVEKRAEILENYFLNKTLSPKYWDAVRSMTVTEFERMANLPQDPGYKLGERAIRIKEILAIVRAEPLKLTPLQGEKMEVFIHRLFTEITRQSGGATPGPEIKKLLKLLDVKQ